LPSFFIDEAPFATDSVNQSKKIPETEPINTDNLGFTHGLDIKVSQSISLSPSRSKGIKLGNIGDIDRHQAHVQSEKLGK